MHSPHNNNNIHIYIYIYLRILSPLFFRTSCLCFISSFNDPDPGPPEPNPLDPLTPILPTLCPDDPCDPCDPCCPENDVSRDNPCDLLPCDDDEWVEFNTRETNSRGRISGKKRS